MIVPNAILLAEVSALVQEGKEVELLTKGCSMLPFIVGDRDSVRLRKEPVAVGDAVLAEIAPGRYVLHRIISLVKDRVVLMGDGNLSGVETCGLSDVKAKAVAVIRPRGKEIDCTTAGLGLPSPHRAPRVACAIKKNDMQIIEGFKLRTVLDENVVVPESVGLVNFNKMISLNSTAAFLWKSVEGREFDVQTLADLLVGEYEVDPQTALRDSEALAKKWIEAGIVKE